MKKLIFSFLIVALASCQDDILDTKPYNAISESLMWTSEDLAEQGVTGIYNTLKSSTTGGLNYATFDGFGFVTQYYKNGTDLGFVSGTVTPNHSLVSDTWKQHYEGIHRANNAIFNIPSKTEAPSETKARLVAEAKFLRAYFYYRLNILFQGVPIYLEPVDNSETTKPRSTAAEVWEQCILDLTDCINEPNLPNNTLQSSLYGRASKGSAYALRGMVYMWLKDYRKAAEDLKAVGQSGYSLYKGDWANLFKPEFEKNSEMILPLQYDEATGFSSNIQQVVGGRSHYDGWTEAQPAPDYVDLHQWADGRPFNWDDVIPGYNSMAVNEREVFFLRDGLDKNSSVAVIKTAYTTVEKRIGTAAMTKYLKDGNEARIKSAYENRDPRLKESVITPYSTFMSWNPFWNSAQEHIGTMRWPLLGQNAPYWDMWSDKRNLGFYIYKKYNAEGKDVYIARDRVYIDLPLIRYTDVVLLLAEALNEADDLAGAIAATNEVRTRAGMPALLSGGGGPNAVAGKEDLRERIRYERRIELALEGVNYFDELRWGTWKSVKFYPGNGVKAYWGALEQRYSWKGDYLWPWPIPAAEIQKNPNITQNPGWIN